MLLAQTISPEMKQLLADLRKKVVIGFVGGSDLSKQKEQLGEDCEFTRCCASSAWWQASIE